MLNIPPVCWAGGGAYVAVQPVVLKVWWALVGAISDLRVVRSVVPSIAQHLPCQASGHEPDRNRIGTGSELDRNWIGTGSEADRNRIGTGSETMLLQTFAVELGS